MDRNRLYRKVLSGVAWQGMSRGVVQAVSWVSTVVVARLLEPADYGVMAVAGVFILILTMIGEMGLAQGLVQKSATSVEEEDGVLYLSLGLALVFYALLYLAAPAIARFYEIEELQPVLRVAGLSLIVSSLKAVPAALTMRSLDFRYRALVELAATLASTGTVLTMALSGMGVWSLVWGSLALHGVTTAGYLRRFPRFPRPSLRFAPLAGIVGYGMHIMGANMASVISTRADVFIIGKFLGEQLTGFYSLAFQLATIPLDKIGTVFNHVAFPSLARAKDDDAQCRAMFLEFHRYLLLIAYPLLLGIALVADDLVLLLLTEKWLPIVPVLQVICVVNALRVSGMLVTPLLNSRGKANLSLRYSLIGMILLPCAFLLGVQFGLIGVAWSWIFAYPLLYALLVHYLRADLGVGIGQLLASARPAITAALGMALCVIAFRHYSESAALPLRLFGAVAVGAIAYGGLFFLVYQEQVDRMRQAWRMLRG